MKKLLVAIVLLFSVNVYSGDKEYCSEIEDIAKTIMEARQDGISLSKLMGVIDPSDKETANLMKEIIIRAYGLPRFSTHEYKAKSVANFGNEWAVICYRN